MTTYKITWSHGQTDYGFESLEAAEEAVRAVLADAEIGHDGDIGDGGERTLFWASEEDAENDDGAKAAGSIRVQHDAEA
jgi:hypothetical protein